MNINNVNEYMQYNDRVMGKDGEVYEFTARITNDYTELSRNIYTYITEDNKHTYTLTESDIKRIATAIGYLYDSLEIFSVMDEILTEILDREFARIREYDTSDIEYDNSNIIRLSDYKLKKHRR